jgi:hypothetical protein
MISTEKQIPNSEKEKKQVVIKRRVEFKKINNNECEFFDVLANLPLLQERVFSHVSNRLLSKHEFWNDKGEIRLTYFVDLLVQAREIVINNRKYTGYPPPYCSGVVVFLNNTKEEIVITPNDSGKLTIKLTIDA